MTWQYVVQWYNGGNMEQENVIRVESKPRNLGSFGLIDIDVWTSSDSDSSSDIANNFVPLSIYVSCSRGTSPILMARVRVSVIVNLANGTVLPVDTIELFDKGNGGELNFYTIIFRNAIIKLIFNFSSIYFDPKCMHNNNFHYM